MRKGLSTALKKRLRRANTRAKVIVQSVVTTLADQVQTKEGWEEADSLTGLTVQDDGSVILSGGSSTALDRDLDDDTEALGGIFPQASTYVATVEWDVDTLDPDFVLESIEAELDPDTGGGQEVDQWVCQLFTAQESPTGTDDWLSTIIPISGRVYVSAGGAVARVSFDFTGGPAVRPASYPAPGSTDPEDPLFTRPTTIIAIWGVQSDGTPAGNIAWRVTAGAGGQYTENGHRVRGWTSSSGGGRFGEEGGASLIADDLPNLEVIYTTYSTATITFTSNPLDLGSVPTGTVQFTALGLEPGGSSLTYEVRNDADTAWVEFQDGDTTEDLAGVGKNQTYDFRVTLTPGTGVTPILQKVAVRELTRTDLDDIATVRERGSVAIDPITLRGEIMEYDIHVIRDGRRDYQDFISVLLSENGLADIELEIYVGHPDLDRSDWLLIDTALVDDHQDGQAGVTLNCLSVSRELEQPIPQVKGSGSLTSDPLEYPNSTLKAVWDDVLANQITLAGRYVGPGVEDTSVNVNNIVENSTGRRILDQVAYIAGGGVIGSQGQIQYRSMYPTDPGGIVAVLPKEEVAPQAVTPGAQYRTPRVSITYGFDFNSGEFTKQYQAEQDNAVTAFGVTALKKATVPDEVGKWVTDDATASTLCERIVESIGEGLILWAVKSTVPYPELEPGDLVAVEVEEFLAKDPNASRAIKGPQLALAVVTAVHDVMGTDFDVWIKSLSDVIPTTTEVTRSTVFGDEDSAGPLGLSNFRLAVQGSTFVRYQWTRGGLVDEVEVQDTLVTIPASTDPWPTSTSPASSTIASTDPQQYEAAYPNAEQGRYLTFRPYTAGGVAGPIVRRILQAPRQPVVDVDFSEEPTVGTLWMSVKGLGVKSVQFSRKVGRNPASTFTSATRVGSTSGPTSVVKGGTLGPGEYEQDVALTNNLNSFVRGRLELYNGDVEVYGPFTFDAGSIPSILGVSSVDRRVAVTGDTDVASVLLKRLSGSTWRRHKDGTGPEFNVAQASTNGAAGMSTDAQWQMRVVAFFNAKVSASTSSTIAQSRVTQDITVTGPAFSAAAAWDAPYPTASAPSTGGFDAKLALKATLTSTSFTYKVEERHDSGGGFTSYVDISTDLDPPVGNISTALSTHGFTTPFERADGGPGSVTYDFRCSILNSTGGNVDQEIPSATWDLSSFA